MGNEQTNGQTEGSGLPAPTEMRAQFNLGLNKELLPSQTSVLVTLAGESVSGISRFSSGAMAQRKRGKALAPAPASLCCAKDLSAGPRDAQVSPQESAILCSPDPTTFSVERYLSLPKPPHWPVPYCQVPFLRKAASTSTSNLDYSQKRGKYLEGRGSFFMLYTTDALKKLALYSKSSFQSSHTSHVSSIPGPGSPGV